jgi:L-fuculose-phosphate aldolase
LAAGRDLNQAMWRAIELEALARQYQLALATGRVAALSTSELDAARAMFRGYRPA